MEPYLAVIAVIVVIGIVFAFVAVMSGGNADDNRRWNNLLVEMYEKNPNATYSAQLEFLRRQKYAAIRQSTTNHEDINELMEDYQMIVDEQERLTEGDRQLGREFEPHVANQTKEGH
jgi:hypothetical protein